MDTFIIDSSKNKIQIGNNSNLVYMSNCSITNLSGISVFLTNITSSYAGISNISTSQLSTVNLSASNISTGNLSTVNLSASNISTGNLSTINLSATNISTGNLSTINLSASNISTNMLSTINLSSSNLSTFNLSATNISTGSLITSNLSSSNLSTFNLSATNISTGALITVNLSSSNLSTFNLSATNISTGSLITLNVSSSNLSTFNLSATNISTGNLSVSGITSFTNTPVCISSPEFGYNLTNKAYVDTRSGQSTNGINLYMNPSLNYPTGPTFGTDLSSNSLYYFDLSSNINYIDISNNNFITNYKNFNISTNITNNADTNICAFITNIGFPYVTSIPSGLWIMNLYSYISDPSGSVYYYFSVYKNTTSNLIAKSAYSRDVNGSSSSNPYDIYTMILPFPDTSINVTDRLLVTITAKSINSGTPKLNTMFEGSNYSFLTTSLNSGTKLLSSNNNWSGQNNFSNVSVTNLTVSRFNLLDDLTDISSTRLTYVTSPSSLSIYHGLKSTLFGYDKIRATINIGLGTDQIHTNMGTYELLSGDVTIIAGSSYGGTITNNANSQIMRNNASTLNIISTFATKECNDKYYLDPSNSTVITNSIYNSVTNNNNFSNTHEMGIMYINAGQETNFKTGIIRHRSPTTPEIYKVSQFGTDNIVDSYYVKSSSPSTNTATVTVQAYSDLTKADYIIDAGIINLKSSRWARFQAPLYDLWNETSNRRLRIEQGVGANLLGNSNIQFICDTTVGDRITAVTGANVLSAGAASTMGQYYITAGDIKLDAQTSITICKPLIPTYVYDTSGTALIGSIGLKNSTKMLADIPVSNTMLNLMNLEVRTIGVYLIEVNLLIANPSTTATLTVNRIVVNIGYGANLNTNSDSGSFTENSTTFIQFGFAGCIKTLAYTTMEVIKTAVTSNNYLTVSVLGVTSPITVQKNSYLKIIRIA